MPTGPRLLRDEQQAIPALQPAKIAA